MDSIFIDAKELIEQGGEFFKQPAVSGLFSQLSSWIGNLRSKNKMIKYQVDEAKLEQDDLLSIKTKLETLEKWNAELQTELDTKSNEIQGFAKQAGMVLHQDFLYKSVKDFSGDISGDFVIADTVIKDSSGKFDNQKFLDALSMLKGGMNVDVTARMSGLDKDLLSGMEKILKD